MHNIERVSEGRVTGWIAADEAGCPGKVTLNCEQQVVTVFASRTREDVRAAGFSLFSGFDLTVSSDLGTKSYGISADGEDIDFSPMELPLSKLLVVEKLRESFISGWVMYPEGLKSLVIYHKHGVDRADIFSRLDVNEALNTSPDSLHGFEISNLEVASIYAININNSHVHWCDQLL